MHDMKSGGGGGGDDGGGGGVRGVGSGDNGDVCMVGCGCVYACIGGKAGMGVNII